MSIKNILMFILAIVSAGVSHAQYGLYIDDIVFPNDPVDSVIQVPVKGRFASNATSCFFRIQLPEGLEFVSVKNDYGRKVFYVQGNDWPQSYEMNMMRKENDNVYNFILWNVNDFSQRVQQAGFYDDLFRLFLRVNNDFSGGIIDISTEYVNCDRIAPAAEWNISEYDANSDGEVSLADYNVIFNSILYESGYSDGCDVNNDGRIDVIDLDAVVDLITDSSNNGLYTGYMLVMTHNSSRVGIEEAAVNAGDVDGDGSIDLSDVTALISTLLNS